MGDGGTGGGGGGGVSGGVGGGGRVSKRATMSGVVMITALLLSKVKDLCCCDARRLDTPQNTRKKLLDGVNGSFLSTSFLSRRLR